MELHAIESSLQKQLISKFPSDAARTFEKMSPQQSGDILKTLPIEMTDAVWERMSPDVTTRIIEDYSDAEIGHILHYINPNVSATLLKNFDNERQANILKGVGRIVATEIRSILHYPDDTAGAIMDPAVIYFRPEMTVKEALTRIRQSKRSGRRIIYLVDSSAQLQGLIEIQEMILVRPDTRLSTLMKPLSAVVDALTPREEVVNVFERNRISSLPVIDADKKLVGIVRYETLLTAAKEEATADIQKMVGVGEDEKALSKVSLVVKRRMPWLQINLLTAFLAAAVVGIFENTIATYTALAVLLPVVAGQSGNTGAQSLAVTMRGLALREVRIRDWGRIVRKEGIAGFLNGVGLALTTGLAVLVWSQTPGLALVIAISMIISMVIAAISGASVPMVLTLFGLDPAQSSSIILTTITDVAGFFSFLGIATMLSSML